MALSSPRRIPLYHKQALETPLATQAINDTLHQLSRITKNEIEPTPSTIWRSHPDAIPQSSLKQKGQQEIFVGI
jgi:hypothetical protein